MTVGSVKHMPRILIHRSSFFLVVAMILSIRIDSLFYYFHIPGIEYLPLVIGVYYLGKNLINRKKLTYATRMSICFFLLYIIDTVIMSNFSSETIQAVLAVAPPFAVMGITEYYAKKNINQFLKVCLCFLVVLMCIDIISILLFPDGLYISDTYSQNWFLGYKTARVRSTTMPAILIAALCERNNGIYNKKFYFVSILACISAGLSGAMGGLVSQIVLIFLLVILLNSQNNVLRKIIFRLLDIRVLIIGILIVNFLIAFVGNVEIFSGLIVNVLGKDITLAGRTKIWAASLNYFLSSPIIGHGFIFSNKYEIISGIVGGASPHNLFLSILVYTGILGVLILFALLFHYIKRVNKVRFDETTICALFILCVMLLGTTSNNMFGQFNFASFTLMDVCLCLNCYGSYTASNKIHFSIKR